MRQTPRHLAPPHASPPAGRRPRVLAARPGALGAVPRPAESPSSEIDLDDADAAGADERASAASRLAVAAMAARRSVVIGGGFVGLSSAMHLQRIGRQVTLVDSARAGSAAAAPGVGAAAPGVGAWAVARAAHGAAAGGAVGAWASGAP